MLYEEEIASHSDPLSQTTESSIRSSNNYVYKLCAVINILIIWSAAQGIISFHIGSNFNSLCSVAFGISSFAQIIIIIYIYHKLLTEHHQRSLITSRNYYNSRKTTERLIAIFGMIVFIILAIVTTFIAFYFQKEKDHTKKPVPPAIPPVFNFIPIPPLKLLIFGIYVIHPYLILIISTLHLSIDHRSEVWKDATIWIILFFPISYLIFINSQLLYFTTRKGHEVIFTLIISMMFFIYAIKFGWECLWNELRNVESEISYSSEIENLEEE
jgi:hypothetical protein